VHPVDDRGTVGLGVVGDLLHLAEHPVDPLGQALGNLHVAQRAALDRGAFGGPHDRALFVDPDGHRDVDEAEQLVGDVGGVDQAGVRGRGGVDPLAWVWAGSTSRATVTTVRPSGSSSVCSACHPGRLVRQPQ
jgi:hypothetical protein